MLLPLVALTIATVCNPPWQAVAVGRTLAAQGVGRDWAPWTKPDCNECTGATSVPAKAMILTFGCEGDYLDELAAEEADGIRKVTFRNDQAFVIVAFLRPVTAREAAVTRLTLATLR
jgi:hypothetical protein